MFLVWDTVQQKQNVGCNATCSLLQHYTCGRDDNSSGQVNTLIRSAHADAYF